MKQILSIALILVSFTACEKNEEPNCPNGYGPNDCNITWSSNYVGTWSSDQHAILEISEETATKIWFNDSYYASIGSLYELAIPTQGYSHAVTGATIIVSGSGQYDSANQTLTMQMQYETNGTTTDQVETYQRQ